MPNDKGMPRHFGKKFRLMKTRVKGDWKDKQNINMKMTVFWDVVPCSLIETD
jgi:hypothetical protein